MARPVSDPDKMATVNIPDNWITTSLVDSGDNCFYTRSPAKDAGIYVGIWNGLYPKIELESEAIQIADWIPNNNSYTDQTSSVTIDNHPAVLYLRTYSDGQKAISEAVTYRESDVCVVMVGYAYLKDLTQVQSIVDSAQISVPSKGLSVYSASPPEHYYGHPETPKVSIVTPATIAAHMPTWLARKYVLNHFVCSEISAYAQHWLESFGIPTKIVASTTQHHAWLICQLSSGEWIPIEPQGGAQCVVTDPKYWKYDLVFNDIYEAMNYNQYEWDWWNA